MPPEHKREGNACDRCKKQVTEVGEITHYTEHGSDLLLCPKCFEKQQKLYTEICPKCKRVAYEHGGMTIYSDSDANDSDVDFSDADDSDPYNGLGYEKSPSIEFMCLECYEKKLAKAKKIRKGKLKAKNFILTNWKFWIGTAIGIGAVIVGILNIF